MKVRPGRGPWLAAFVIGLLNAVQLLATIAPRWVVSIQGVSASPYWVWALQVAGVLYFLALVVTVWVGLSLWRSADGRRGSAWFAVSWAVQLAALVLGVVLSVIAGRSSVFGAAPVGLVVFALELAALRVAPVLATVTLATGLILSEGIPRWVPVLSMAAVALDLAPLATALRRDWFAVLAPSTIDRFPGPPVNVAVLGYSAAVLTVVFWFALGIVLRNHGLQQTGAGSTLPAPEGAPLP